MVIAAVMRKWRRAEAEVFISDDLVSVTAAILQYFVSGVLTYVVNHAFP
jgi:hypothetical protein